MNKMININATRLRELMASKHERDYSLIDVRQEKEYNTEHIPGAQLIPLGNLASELPKLPEDGDVIFYCRSGHRSRAAALFFEENKAFAGTIYNLQGGILDWNHLTLPDFPNLKVFSPEGGEEVVYYQAMDLERGAYHYYSEVAKRFPDAAFTPIIKRLAHAAEEYARLIYNLYTEEISGAPPFEELYASLPGEVIEGGHSLSTLRKLVDEFGEDPCVDIVELAIGIEFSAYDLYRNMAERFEKKSNLNKTFLSIAQAEKEHMRLAASMLTLCQPT